MANDYISNENRQMIINLYLDGRTPADIASIVRFKKSAIYAIIKAYKTDGQIVRKLKGGARRVALSDAAKIILQGWVDEDYGLTLHSLAQKCNSELGLSVSPSTIDRALKSFSYSFKRTHSIPERRNEQDVIAKRAEYAETILERLSLIDDAKIYFIDEVGFNVSMRTRGGSSLRGTTPIHVVPSLRSRNVSVCCAMNKHSIVSYKAQTRAYNSECFLDFMKDLLDTIQSSGIQSAVFVMDNVAFHKVDSIKNLISDAHFEILYLPPYS
ncbi:hypothetical protein ENBRE01_2973, partial [Enteropsectra breve]